MDQLIIDGKSVYEVDEECLRNRRIPKTCEVDTQLITSRKQSARKEQENKNLITNDRINKNS